MPNIVRVFSGDLLTRQPQGLAPTHNTVLLPLPEIFNPGEYFSIERMEVLGFRNCEDPATNRYGNRKHREMEGP